jgi:hypothetical protein
MVGVSTKAEMQSQGSSVLLNVYGTMCLIIRNMSSSENKNFFLWQVDDFEVASLEFVLK